MERRVEELELNADRFDFEDWRSVVPDVRSDAEGLAAAVKELRARASGLEQELIRAEVPGDYELRDPW